MISDTFYSRFFHLLLLSVLVMICYSNSLNAPWHFDDFHNIVDNRSIKIKDFSFSEIYNVIISSINDSWSNKRPVAAITFAINYLFSGEKTDGYHKVNIFLHMISVWIVYLVFIETIYLYNKKYNSVTVRNDGISGPGIALLGSVMWGIHPIHTQAVTYIVQRQTVLAGMFYLLAMYCYIKARLSKGALFTIIWIALLVIFFLLGIGSKQNAALLPLGLIGYEVAFFRSSLLAVFKKNKVFWTSTLISAIVLLVLCLNVCAVFAQLMSAYEFRTFTVWERLLTQPIILFKYLFLILAPLSNFLCLESDILVSRSLFDPPYTIVAAFAITCLWVFGLYLLKRDPFLGFAIFFFFVNHIIESTFIPLELYFEHRNYIPSVFIYLLMSYFFVYVIYLYKKRKKLILKSIFLIFVIIFLVSEGNATYLRNEIWGDEIVLLEDTIRKAPGNIRPYISLVALYAKKRKYGESIEYFNKAEKMLIDNMGKYQVNMPALLYFNAAMIYTYDWEKRDIEKAIGLLYKSISYINSYYLAHMNLGLLLFEKGKHEQAEVSMRNAYLLNKDKSSIFYINFGRILLSTGKIEEAIDAFTKGFLMERSDVARLNLVAAFISKGDLYSARSVLADIDVDNTSPAYLFSFALLRHGHEVDSALEKLAVLIANSGVSYCEWIDRIMKNNFLGIVYPDIHSVEPKLKMKYIDYLSRLYNSTDDTLKQIEGCIR